MEKSILKKVLATDLSNIKVDESGTVSLIDSYPNKSEDTTISDLRLMQVILARKAIIEKSSYLGELLEKGEFLVDNRLDSHWVVYRLNDEKGRIGVLWNHFDDDSWSVFFKGDNLEIDFLVYEN